jgi:hypothetical protein
MAHKSISVFLPDLVAQVLGDDTPRQAADKAGLCQSHIRRMLEGEVTNPGFASINALYEAYPEKREIFAQGFFPEFQVCLHLEKTFYSDWVFRGRTLHLYNCNACGSTITRPAPK